MKKKLAEAIIACFKRGGKVILAGNGGSLTDATHFAAEFTGIGPVIVLNDPAKITAIANDYGFENVFWKQVKDIGEDGDLFIAVSSSGKSENVKLAMDQALESCGEIIEWPRKGKTTQERQMYQYKLFHEVYLEVKKQWRE